MKPLDNILLHIETSVLSKIQTAAKGDIQLMLLQAYLESYGLSCLIHSRRAIQEGHQWRLRYKTPSQGHSPVRAAWPEGGMVMSHARRPGRRLGPSQSARANELFLFFLVNFWETFQASKLRRCSSGVRTSSATFGNIPRQRQSARRVNCHKGNFLQRTLKNFDRRRQTTFKFVNSRRCSCILVSCLNTIGNIPKYSQSELFCTSK